MYVYIRYAIVYVKYWVLYITYLSFDVRYHILDIRYSILYIICHILCILSHRSLISDIRWHVPLRRQGFVHLGIVCMCYIIYVHMIIY